MPIKQMPLPGFDEEPIVEKLSSKALLFMMHLALRDEMRQLFDHEISVLREMGRMNNAQCSDGLYLAQRQLCSAIKEVVIKLDVMNDLMQGEPENE